MLFFILYGILSLISPIAGIERGTIIPLYIYPKNADGSDAWKPLIDAYNEYPIDVWAVVNVFNGPGSTEDANYAKAIFSLTSVGINTLGYVSTNYTNRTSSVVQNDINSWKSWYNTTGIFLDEMTNDDSNAHLLYYTELDKYIKSKGFTFTVGNPGTDVPLKYFEAVDTVMIYEKQNFPANNTVCSGKYNSLPVEALGIFPYNVAALDEAMIEDTKKCIGFIYVTNDNGSNPWDSLPPYLPQLFKILSK